VAQSGMENLISLLTGCKIVEKNRNKNTFE
jgi:hypothetical protein